MKVNQIKFIAEQNIPGIRWYCSVADADGNESDSSAQTAQNGTKIDNLALVIASIQQEEVAMQQHNQIMFQMLKDRSSNTALEDKIKVHVTEVIHNEKEAELVKNNIIIKGVPEDVSEYVLDQDNLKS